MLPLCMRVSVSSVWSNPTARVLRTEHQRPRSVVPEYPFNLLLSFAHGTPEATVTQPRLVYITPLSELNVVGLDMVVNLGPGSESGIIGLRLVVTILAGLPGLHSFQQPPARQEGSSRVRDKLSLVLLVSSVPCCCCCCV